MVARGLGLALSLMLAPAGGCSKLAARAAAERDAGPAADATRPHAGASNVPHMDHNPQHGGQVSMAGDLHIELVTTSTGHERVYLTDAVREKLTTEGVTGAKFTVTRPDGSEEPIALRSVGPFLEGSGRPLGPGTVLGRLELVHPTQKVSIDFVIGGESAPVPIDKQRDPESTGRKAKTTNRPATLIR
jgi:hypothetical protein